MLAPSADNGMTRDHYDALGVCMANPVSIFGDPLGVAELATAGVYLMGAASPATTVAKGWPARSPPEPSHYTLANNDASLASRTPPRWKRHST